MPYLIILKEPVDGKSQMECEEIHLYPHTVATDFGFINPSNIDSIIVKPE